MKTEYICWNQDTGFAEEELERAAAIIQDGGLVAFPTETVYGLGGDGLCKEASEKIYAAKGRPSDNPLILHIGSRQEVTSLVKNISEKAEYLMEAFWPGPMTLVFEKSDIVPYETTGGLDTVAIRMPGHEGARELIRAAKVPIAAPSANTSGRPSPTNAEHVKEDLDGSIDMIIDGGEVGIGLESTIIDLTEEIPVILRPGFITKDMIEEVVGEVKMDPGIAGENPAQPPKAPGMKYRHYAPKADMTVYEGDSETVVNTINRLAAEYPTEKVGILATDETKECYIHGQVISVGSRKTGRIGHKLYAALREFDHLGVDVIFSESFSDEEKSEAVMNRLLKAAGQHIIYLTDEENGGKKMADYNKIIFVCKENSYLSPMAEWIMKSILMDKSIEISSRGLVVLFPEPRNMKVTDILMNHAIPCEEQVSQAFDVSEVDEKTLVIAMNFMEKVKLIEDYELSDSQVYTIREFAEEEGDIADPYGGDESVYEACYVELKDLLYKIKKRLGFS